MRILLTILALCVALPLAAEPQAGPKFKGPRGAGMGPRGGGPGKGPIMRRGPAPWERLQRMSPEERREALRNLPPERREAMEKRLESMRNLSPEERDRLRGSLEKFQDMTPERQQQLRESFRQFSETFPPERRPDAQRMIRRLRMTSDEEARRHLLSDRRYLDQFSEEERKVIERMAAEMPD
jgi:hypothetical protein